MNKNTILRSYGTDYKNMTKRLLAVSELSALLKERSKKLRKEKPELNIGIKPNVLGCNPAEFGATTHTEVIAGIIEYLQESGYENISVMEGAWVGDKTSEAFEILGYISLAAQYKVELIDNQKQSSFKADCAGMQLNICNSYKNVDFFINVPVLKGHCQTKITCALKNMKGMIPNSEKRRFHSMGLHKPIAHLNTYIKQDFIVIDHICGDPDFEEGGNPLITNCVMTAQDPVLVDAYAAEILGYRPYDIEYIRLAEELGAGSANLDNLELITIEGKCTESEVDIHKILNVNYAVDDIESCSACYGMLISALSRLKEEGLLQYINERICIGQGYRGKIGKCGVGNCTSCFEFNIPGCPPAEEEIYTALKNRFS